MHVETLPSTPRKTVDPASPAVPAAVGEATRDHPAAVGAGFGESDPSRDADESSLSTAPAAAVVADEVLVRSVVPKTCSLLPVLRLLRACTHAYHALTRVLGPCAVACADAFARTDVLALHMPAACAMP